MEQQQEDDDDEKYMHSDNLPHHSNQVLIFVGVVCEPDSFTYALRRSNTTALQQLPVGDHGGRINTQMKGSVLGERRLSARLKKWDALRPHTSARPSSLNNAGGDEQGTQGELTALTDSRSSAERHWSTQRRTSSGRDSKFNRVWLTIGLQQNI
ncbi:hypothetical protein EYF80_020881 [Liparis tanakae]|uniref:Uncharacterized protein n=1 Tax=Liparis tanakae TaxID=230148 RepID=A0A4Z2HSL8_9TELE|nr:hypothetical protein EYF80_020881 [Liparis tanakae]